MSISLLDRVYIGRGLPQLWYKRRGSEDEFCGAAIVDNTDGGGGGIAGLISTRK